MLSYSKSIGEGRLKAQTNQVRTPAVAGLFNKEIQRRCEVRDLTGATPVFFGIVERRLFQRYEC